MRTSVRLGRHPPKVWTSAFAQKAQPSSKSGWRTSCARRNWLSVNYYSGLLPTGASGEPPPREI
eukprot:5492489-Pleurochrysis_carterae.AAC.1